MLVRPGPVRHRGVEQLGVVPPVLDRQADQAHGDDGGDRVGQVGDQVHATRSDALVEKPHGQRLGERAEGLDGRWHEIRGQDPAQFLVHLGFGLGDTRRGDAPGPWNACDAPAPDPAAVAEPAREGGLVARHLGHLVVAAHHPEPAVAGGVGDRGGAHRPPARQPVGEEARRVVVEVHDELVSHALPHNGLLPAGPAHLPSTIYDTCVRVAKWVATGGSGGGGRRLQRTRRPRPGAVAPPVPATGRPTRSGRCAPPGR